jgi:hypothetical protein
MNTMHSQKETSTIQCGIHQESFATMNVIKQQINHESSVGKKAAYAETLLDRVACLLDCPKYNDQESDCEYCHVFAELHKKTAELIIKAKRLSP